MLQKMLNHLKNKWKIKSTGQVVCILAVFTLAGFTTAYTHRFVNYLTGNGADTSFWIKTALFVFLILPVWLISFVFWGTVFGQTEFVKVFLKTKYRLLTEKIINEKIKK